MNKSLLMAALVAAVALAACGKKEEAAPTAPTVATPAPAPAPAPAEAASPAAAASPAMAASQ
jgi:nitrous oxide reductase accessory protein NosL